ncbi:MAG: protocatechuate 3,4-dioxygenase beta subunit, partial [Planctomycetota bacterium]
AGWQSRERDSDVEGQFEFRAVDSSLNWMLMPNLEDHYAPMNIGVQVEAGQTNELDLEFTLGASITGLVVDSEGNPLPGVEVSAGGDRRMQWMGGGNARSEETDEEGRFSLRGLAPGKLELEATLDGWLDSKSEEMELADGEELSELTLVMESGYSIKGLVRSPDKQPIEGAKVRVERLASRNWGGWGGGSRVRREGETTTDASGRFVVSGLEEGSFTVRASFEDEVQDTVARAVLENVETAGPDVILNLNGSIVFAGRVVDDIGQPVTAFQIRLASSDQGGPRDREDYESADGSFQFSRVGPGTWSVRVTAEGYDQPKEVELFLPSAGELLLEVQRTARIAGVVLDTSGDPLAGATVELSEGSSSGGFGGWGGSSGPSAKSEIDGSFVFENVAPGSISLLAKAEGLADSLASAFELAPSQQVEEVLLALRVGGKITGQVLNPDGYPEAGQRVTWGSNAMGFGSRGDTNADSDGRFVFENVTPGEWAVSAVPSMEEFGKRMQEGGENAFVDVMGKLITKTVTVNDMEQVEVFLGGEPRQPVRIHGMVTRAGEPLAGASVYAVSEASAVFEGMKTALADDNGVYELVIDRPGSHTISATSGSIGVERVVEVPRREELLVDLAIPLGRIEGRVTEPDRTPAGGVRLALQREDGLGRIRWAGGQKTTDADGRYAFDDLEAGIYTVRANVATWGGSSDESFGTSILSSVEVEKDRTASGVDFKLEKAGTVVGLVVDENDSPLPGASLFFRDAGGRLVTSVSSTVSDANGRFEKTGLAPGDYTVSARNESMAAGDEANVRVSSDQTAKVEVALSTGVMLLVTLEDESGEGLRSRVEVLDADGNDVAGMMSAANMRETFNNGRSTVEQRVGPIPPGRYTIRGTSTDGRTRERNLNLKARSSEKKVNLKLKGDS